MKSITKYRDQATRYTSRRDAVRAAKKAEAEYPDAMWYVRQYRNDGYYVLFDDMPEREHGIKHGWL